MLASMLKGGRAFQLPSWYPYEQQRAVLHLIGRTNVARRKILLRDIGTCTLRIPEGIGSLLDATR